MRQQLQQAKNWGAQPNSTHSSSFGEQKEAEGNMHPHDQVVKDFHALKPHLFTTLVRLDLREQFSFDIVEQEALLQLWFRADDVQEANKPFLHLSLLPIPNKIVAALCLKSTFVKQLKGLCLIPAHV
jgi:hypothetical protein